MDEKEKDKLRDLLKPFQIPNPPTAVLENYKDEVWRKIEDSRNRPLFANPIFWSALSVAVILVAGLTFFLLPRDVPGQKRSVPAAIQMEPVRPVSL